MTIKIKPRETCQWDAVSLGEVMLRLDPGEGRIRTAREFKVWEGGGDSFASGLIYGFLAGKTPQESVEYGAAHGALAMSTPGDTSMVTVKEVEAIIKGKGARVIR